MDKDEKTPFWLEKDIAKDDERLARTQTPHNNGAVGYILHQHHLWVESNGKQGERLVLKGQNLRGVDLEGSNLDGAICNHTSFQGAELGAVNFRNAMMCSSKYDGADMRDSRLKRVRLNGSDLTNTDIGTTSGGRGRGR